MACAESDFCKQQLGEMGVEAVRRRRYGLRGERLLQTMMEEVALLLARAENNTTPTPN